MILNQMYLEKVVLHKEKIDHQDYIYSLPIIKHMNELLFCKPVTFFIGENGSGKSTLIEAIAVKWGLNPEGGSKNFLFHTRATHSNLHQYLSLIKGYQRPRDSYFLRAETFYNLATNMEDLDRETGLGKRIVDSYGGKSLHQCSHGESFIHLLCNRFGGNGLYILDEPEACLLYTSQTDFLL